MSAFGGGGGGIRKQTLLTKKVNLYEKLQTRDSEEGSKNTEKTQMLETLFKEQRHKVTSDFYHCLGPVKTYKDNRSQ